MSHWNRNCGPGRAVPKHPRRRQNQGAARPGTWSPHAACSGSGGSSLPICLYFLHTVGVEVRRTSGLKGPEPLDQVSERSFLALET